MDKHEAYQSYLLRIWQEDVGGEPVWRASLEHAQTSELRHFANLRDLVRYLSERAADGVQDSLPEPHARVAYHLT